MWAVLLFVGQALDVITTGVDRARGTIEAVPWTATVLVTDGLPQWAALKLLLAVAAATALALTARWARRRSPALVVYRFALNACRITTVVAVLASLSNAALLTTLSQ